VQAQIPASLRAQHASLTAYVAVTLDTAGQVIGARVYRSSGNADVDGAALTAARSSKFAPGARECKPTGGTYLVAETLDATALAPPPSATACDHDVQPLRLVDARFPDEARYDRAFGTVVVDALVDPSGHFISAKIARSSGNPFIDAAAVQAARESTFKPKMVACKAVAGEYELTTNFNSIF
jgi:TonB family protein